MLHAGKLDRAIPRRLIGPGVHMHIPPKFGQFLWYMRTRLYESAPLPNKRP